MVEGGLGGGWMMVGVIWSTRTLSAVTAGMTYKYKYKYTYMYIHVVLDFFLGKSLIINDTLL